MKIKYISVFLFSVVQSSFAASYFVSTKGSGSSTSCSLSDPCRSIMKAYSKVTAGDIVVVKPGVYTQYNSNYGNLLNKSGTSSKPITIISETPLGAIIDLQNKVHSCLFITGSYHVIQGFRIRNGYSGGIELREGHSNKIIKNEIYNNGTEVPLSDRYGQDGISGSGNNATIDGNYIHHNGRGIGRTGLDHGIYLSGDNLTITNNIISYNSATGMQIAGYDISSNIKIYNNTVVSNGSAGILIWKKMSGVDIANNIMYKNKTGFSSYNASGPGVVLRNNIYYGNQTVKSIYPSGSVSIKESNQILSNPLFTSESNYRLRVGSPAIDHGVLVPVKRDYDGKIRPRGRAIDIGAFEK